MHWIMSPAKWRLFCPCPIVSLWKQKQHRRLGHIRWTQRCYSGKNLNFQISILFKQILCIESPKPIPQSVFMTLSLFSRHLYNSRCFSELWMQITFSTYLSLEVPAAKKQVQGGFSFGKYKSLCSKARMNKKRSTPVLLSQLIILVTKVAAHGRETH